MLQQAGAGRARATPACPPPARPPARPALQVFPHVRELVLHGLTLSPRDMLCLGALGRLATLRLLSCTVEEGASVLALAALTQASSLALVKSAMVGSPLPSNSACGLSLWATAAAHWPKSP